MPDVITDLEEDFNVNVFVCRWHPVGTLLLNIVFVAGFRYN